MRLNFLLFIRLCRPKCILLNLIKSANLLAYISYHIFIQFTTKLTNIFNPSRGLRFLVCHADRHHRLSPEPEVEVSCNVYILGEKGSLSFMPNDW